MYLSFYYTITNYCVMPLTEDSYYYCNDGDILSWLCDFFVSLIVLIVGRLLLSYCCKRQPNMKCMKAWSIVFEKLGAFGNWLLIEIQQDDELSEKSRVH